MRLHCIQLEGALLELRAHSVAGCLICGRGRIFRCTSGMRTTRRTRPTSTRVVYRGSVQSPAMAKHRSTSLTSASRTRAGMSARWCSSTERQTRTRTAPGSTLTSTVSERGALHPGRGCPSLGLGPPRSLPQDCPGGHPGRLGA